MKNKFLEYCKEHDIRHQLVHKLPIELMKDYFIAKQEGHVKEDICPYGEIFEVLVEFDK